MSAPNAIAVIGAGLAGLTCAAELARAGHSVTVFEKSRGLGGRLATRRRDVASYDHGAQYVTATSAGFARWLDVCAQAGAAAEWDATQARVGDPAFEPDSRVRYVGTPGMNALVKPMAHDLDIRLVETVIALRNAGGRHTPHHWTLVTANGASHGPFAHVVCTAPAPQTQSLLEPHDARFAVLANVGIAPCWTAMFSFTERLANAPDTIRTTTGETVAWAARNSSKPGRDAGAESWVVQAGDPFTHAHLDADKEAVATLLVTALLEHLKIAVPPPVIDATAHRWLYARVTDPLGQEFLSTETHGLHAAGDWCLAARAQAAFTSGAAVARHVLGLVGDA